MKYSFLVIGLIANMLSVNGMQLSRTPSKPLDRSRSLPFRKLTNTIAQNILNEKWNDESEQNDQIKRYLLELCEWYAHITKKKDEEKIYQSALKEHFGKTEPMKMTDNLPKLTNASLKIPLIKNTELNSHISEIIAQLHTISIDNFDRKIDKKNQEILAFLNTPNTDSTYKQENDLQKLITTQLTTIKARFNFTHDTNKLAENLESLKQKAPRISAENLVLLKELNNKIAEQTLETELPITEPAPEEQPSSSISIEEPREPEKESELPIIPYEEFSLAKLFKIPNPETQASASLPEKPLSSSSSSSSTSPVPTPLASPRKEKITSEPIKIVSHETREPGIVPKKQISNSSSISTESSEEPTPLEVSQIPEGPSQATKDEFYEKLPLPTSEPSEKPNRSLIDTPQEVEELNTSESPTSSTAHMIEEQTTETQNPSKEAPTPPSSSFWDSWLVKKITSFLDTYFWSINWGYH